MSGVFHETTGFMKRNIGRILDDSVLEKAGRHQQLLGKIHRLVGTVRGVQAAAIVKVNRTRVASQSLLGKHGGRLLDGISDFVDEAKKIFLE